MLIRHLSYFVTLARERHFARAAAACNVTQPTLSAAIRKLEEDVGVRLVVRDHRFVRLTEEGEKLLVWGRQILSDYNSLRDDLAGSRRGLTGTLHLGVIPAAMSTVSFLTKPFAALHPAANVEIRSLTSREIERALAAFEIDAGVTYLENEPLSGVRKVPLYQERYVFVMRRDRPGAVKGGIPWKEAAAERLCLLSENMQNRRIINNVMASINVTVKADVVSDSFLAILAHVRDGGWASIVPHTFAHLFSGAGDIVALDLIEPMHTQAVGLVLSDREPSSPMASALLAATADADLERDIDAMRNSSQHAR